ncbi:ankyrin repeat domain-containing protein 31 isoform X2 [Ascaphus truei]|uniref:ankyrin repeat domain-containing protein 31 isoform X2 n=1 Tax=Ascaphus truei TaxID=8439 RepID=UPI003F5A696E
MEEIFHAFGQRKDRSPEEGNSLIVVKANALSGYDSDETVVDDSIVGSDEEEDELHLKRLIFFKEDASFTSTDNFLFENRPVEKPSPEIQRVCRLSNQLLQKTRQVYETQIEVEQSQSLLRNWLKESTKPKQAITSSKTVDTSQPFVYMTDFEAPQSECLMLPAGREQVNSDAESPEVSLLSGDIVTGTYDAGRKKELLVKLEALKLQNLHPGPEETDGMGKADSASEEIEACQSKQLPELSDTETCITPPNGDEELNIADLLKPLSGSGSLKGLTPPTDMLEVHYSLSGMETSSESSTILSAELVTAINTMQDTIANPASELQEEAMMGDKQRPVIDRELVKTAPCQLDDDCTQIASLTYAHVGCESQDEQKQDINGYHFEEKRKPTCQQRETGPVTPNHPTCLAIQQPGEEAQMCLRQEPEEEVSLSLTKKIDTPSEAPRSGGPGKDRRVASHPPEAENKTEQHCRNQTWLNDTTRNDILAKNERKDPAVGGDEIFKSQHNKSVDVNAKTALTLRDSDHGIESIISCVIADKKPCHIAQNEAQQLTEIYFEENTTVKIVDDKNNNGVGVSNQAISSSGKNPHKLQRCAPTRGAQEALRKSARITQNLSGGRIIAGKEKQKDIENASPKLKRVVVSNFNSDYNKKTLQISTKSAQSSSSHVPFSECSVRPGRKTMTAKKAMSCLEQNEDGALTELQLEGKAKVMCLKKQNDSAITSTQTTTTSASDDPGKKEVQESIETKDAQEQTKEATTYTLRKSARIRDAKFLPNGISGAGSSYREKHAEPESTKLTLKRAFVSDCDSDGTKAATLVSQKSSEVITSDHGIHPERTNNKTAKATTASVTGPDRQPALPRHQFNRKNCFGETKLHKAAMEDDKYMAHKLIKAGAQVDVRDYAGWTPLHEACVAGYYHIAKILLDAGADVNVKGLGQVTPIHDAVKEGHYEVVQLLLNYGANPLLVNENGKTAYEEIKTECIRNLLSAFVSKTSTSTLYTGTATTVHKDTGTTKQQETEQTMYKISEPPVHKRRHKETATTRHKGSKVTLPKGTEPTLRKKTEITSHKKSATSPQEAFASTKDKEHVTSLQQQTLSTDLLHEMSLANTLMESSINPHKESSANPHKESSDNPHKESSDNPQESSTNSHKESSSNPHKESSDNPQKESSASPKKKTSIVPKKVAIHSNHKGTSNTLQSEFLDRPQKETLISPNNEFLSTSQNDFLTIAHKETPSSIKDAATIAHNDTAASSQKVCAAETHKVFSQNTTLTAPCKKMVTILHKESIPMSFSESLRTMHSSGVNATQNDGTVSPLMKAAYPLHKGYTSPHVAQNKPFHKESHVTSPFQAAFVASLHLPSEVSSQILSVTNTHHSCQTYKSHQEGIASPSLRNPLFHPYLESVACPVEHTIASSSEASVAHLPRTSPSPPCSQSIAHTLQESSFVLETIASPLQKPVVAQFLPPSNLLSFLSHQRSVNPPDTPVQPPQEVVSESYDSYAGKSAMLPKNILPIVSSVTPIIYLCENISESVHTSDPSCNRYSSDSNQRKFGKDEEDLNERFEVLEDAQDVRFLIQNVSECANESVSFQQCSCSEVGGCDKCSGSEKHPVNKRICGDHINSEESQLDSYSQLSVTAVDLDCTVISEYIALSPEPNTSTVIPKEPGAGNQPTYVNEEGTLPHSFDISRECDSKHGSLSSAEKDFSPQANSCIIANGSSKRNVEKNEVIINNNKHLIQAEFQREQNSQKGSRDTADSFSKSVYRQRAHPQIALQPESTKQAFQVFSKAVGNIHKRNAAGETQLHLAAKKGDFTLVKVLLEAGINVNQKDNAGWTAIHEASSRGFTEVILQLLQAGADVNSIGLDRILPIHDAVSGNHFKAAELLLQHGANSDQRDKNAENAFDKSCNDQMRELLKSYSTGMEAPTQENASGTGHSQLKIVTDPASVSHRYSTREKCGKHQSIIHTLQEVEDRQKQILSTDLQTSVDADKYIQEMRQIQDILNDILITQKNERDVLSKKYRASVDSFKQGLLREQLAKLASRQKNLLQVVHNQKEVGLKIIAYQQSKRSDANSGEKISSPPRISSERNHISALCTVSKGLGASLANGSTMATKVPAVSVVPDLKSNRFQSTFMRYIRSSEISSTEEVPDIALASEKRAMGCSSNLTLKDKPMEIENALLSSESCSSITPADHLYEETNNHLAFTAPGNKSLNPIPVTSTLNIADSRSIIANKNNHPAPAGSQQISHAGQHPQISNVEEASQEKRKANMSVSAPTSNTSSEENIQLRGTEQAHITLPGCANQKPLHSSEFPTTKKQQLNRGAERKIRRVQMIELLKMGKLKPGEDILEFKLQVTYFGKELSSFITREDFAPKDLTLPAQQRQTPGPPCPLPPVPRSLPQVLQIRDILRISNKEFLPFQIIDQHWKQYMESDNFHIW